MIVSCPALLIYFFIVRPCCQKKPICCCRCCCRRLTPEEREDRREKEILKQIDGGNNKIVPANDEGNRPPDPNNDSEIAMVALKKAESKGSKYEDSDIGAESIFDERGTALGLYATNGNKEAAAERLQSQGNESHDFYINESDDQIR